MAQGAAGGLSDLQPNPPVGETPSLMSFGEVETLFHEFGHGLQHMLTTVEEPEAAGINGVEWDAVDCRASSWRTGATTAPPSMAWRATGKPGAPPEAERQKLLQAKTFMAGAATLRQVHLALTDLRLHEQWRAEMARAQSNCGARWRKPPPCCRSWKKTPCRAALATSSRGLQRRLLQLQVG